MVYSGKRGGARRMRTRRRDRRAVAIAGNPASYDEQDVTVSGTVKNPTTRHFPRGTATRYQLCDSACVTVIQFGDAGVTDGTTASVTGRFHTQFGRRHVMTNVVVVGGRRPGT